MAGIDLSIQTYDSDCVKVQPDEINALVTWLKKDIKTTKVIDNTNSPYTVLATDVVILCDTDTADITLNLPAGVNGKTYKVVNVGTSGNVVTVAPNGTELIDGVNASKDLSDGSIIDLTYTTTYGWY